MPCTRPSSTQSPVTRAAQPLADASSGSGWSGSARGTPGSVAAAARQAHAARAPRPTVTMRCHRRWLTVRHRRAGYPTVPSIRPSCASCHARQRANALEQTPYVLVAACPEPSRPLAAGWHPGPDGARARHPPARCREALRRDHRRRRARPRRAGRDVRRTARPQRRGQVDHDAAADGAVDRRRGRARAARLQAARRVQAGPRPARRRAAAGQPRHDLDRRAEPARVRTPVPHPALGAPRRDRAGARDGEAGRPARLARRQALGRDAAAPADRTRARPPAPARAAWTSPPSGSTHRCARSSGR